MSREEIHARVMEVLEIVQIPQPKRRFEMYPHQLSGGQRQRVMIAQALLCSPDLLIADEPTTALDLTIQAQILDFFKSLKKRTTIVIITHDLGVVAGLCNRVVVMYAGRIVEQGSIEEIFMRPAAPLHPGAAGRRAAPGLGPGQASSGHRRPAAAEHAPVRGMQFRPALRPRDGPLPAGNTRTAREATPQGLPPGAAGMSRTLLKVENLKVYFPSRVQGGVRRRYVPLKAVDDVSFTVAEGETVGIVGESGCGKSTLARAILQLIESTRGRIVWQGEDLTRLGRKAMNEKRRDLGIVFQDPLSSLNPRMTIGNIIAEPLRRFHSEMSREDINAAVLKTMRDVGLNREYLNRYPHEFSGGQCQRVSIARAMILRPKLVICDEPVSALDVSTRTQTINLLKDLQRKHGISIIFISHDLSVVRIVCTRNHRNVPGSFRGDRGPGHAVRFAVPPLHAGLAQRHSRPRPRVAGRPQEGDSQGRTALAHRAAVRMRVPDPLPDSHELLHQARADSHAARERGAGGLPPRLKAWVGIRERR